MRMPSKSAVIVCLLAALALGACRSRPPEQPAPDAGTGQPTQQGTLDRPADVGTEGEGDVADDAAAGPQEGMLQKRIIYFEFDSAEIRGEGTEIVAAHAKHLAGNANVRVRLEGHTDERGSREYNIGLGERRAQAVRRALMLQGAGEPQLSTVSYGEERPTATGTDEPAWQQNRRVEIIYTTG